MRSISVTEIISSDGEKLLIKEFIIFVFLLLGYEDDDLGIVLDPRDQLNNGI